MERTLIAALLLLMCQLTHQTGVNNKAKILLFPAPSNSHYMYFSIIGKQLIQYGHKVYMVTTPNHEWIKNVPNYGIKLLTWKVSQPEFSSRSNSKTTELIRTLVNNEINYITTYRHLNNPAYNYTHGACTNLLKDHELMQKLKDMKFDLLILDGVPARRCQLVPAYKLGVPHVTLSTAVEPWLARAHALPSFVPFTLAVSFSQKMTFLQKLQNIWTQIEWVVWPNVPSLLNDSLVSQYIPEKPFKSLTDLARQSILWLYNTDPLLDDPVPSMPNIIQIGGLTTAPAKPLSAQLDVFIRDAKKGLIIVSFGSIVNMSFMPQEILDVLVETLKQLPDDIKVIWKNDIGSQHNLSENIFALPWIPQNDLLGDEKALLFITHCGSNGQFEALYHGVPMIGLPLFTDQKHNARRMDSKGFGIALDTKSVTVDKLSAAIMKMLTVTSYRENIKKASMIYRSRPDHPKQRAAFWINHILKFGGRHLQAVYLPWYQYLMLDILVSMIICVFLVVYVITKLVKQLFSM